MKQTLQNSGPGRSIWSLRDVRLVLPARAVSYAGDSIALVALMLRVSENGGPGAITALLLAFAVPTVVMIPFAGRIVDGYDSRKVLVRRPLGSGSPSATASPPLWLWSASCSWVRPWPAQRGAP